MTEFRNLIESAKKLLITSHYNPDPDAVGSSLGLYNVLSRTYPEKEFRIVVDGVVGDYALSYENREKIENAKVGSVLEVFRPDVLLCTDASGFDRFDSNGVRAFQTAVDEVKPVLISFDHHEKNQEWTDSCTWYRNILASSASEEVYTVLVESGFSLTNHDRFVFLVGMIADTGRFLFPNNHPHQTLKTLGEMFDAGMTIAEAQKVLSSVSLIHVTILQTLLKNMRVQSGYNYSFLTDEELDALYAEAGSYDVFSKGTHLFYSQYLRQVEGTECGFVVFKSIEKPSCYTGSLRSDSRVDCNIIASSLGGGGHKGAAGFEFEAGSLEEAVKRVEAKIVLQYREKCDILVKYD